VKLAYSLLSSGLTRAGSKEAKIEGYREGSMKPLLIFLPLLLAGCGDGATVLLVHPKTGEQITCRERVKKGTGWIFETQQAKSSLSPICPYGV
jgi:hypothetical protein